MKSESGYVSYCSVTCNNNQASGDVYTGSSRGLAEFRVKYSGFNVDIWSRACTTYPPSKTSPSARV